MTIAQILCFFSEEAHPSTSVYISHACSVSQEICIYSRKQEIVFLGQSAQMFQGCSHLQLRCKG